MDPIPVLIEKLARLSEEDLERSAQRFARREKRNGAGVIAHIAEISRRDLHLRMGYRDLFEYVEDRLGFRGGSAGLRIHVAKKARDYPRLLEALWKEELCLSGAALLVPHLTPENVDRLVSEAARKSTREIKESLRKVAPLPVYEPGIRKQPERAPVEEIPLVSEPRAEAPAAATASLPALPGELPLPGVVAPPGRDLPLAAAVRRTSNVLEAATPETYNFRFSADRAFRDKLERLAEVLGVRDPVQHMGEILERAVDCLLERKDPERRRARRLAREERRRLHRAHDVDLTTGPVEPTGAKAPIEAAEPAPEPQPEPTRAEARRPRAADWDEALERADYQCEYRGRDGRRCTARAGLQPDHYPVPWSVSRSSDPEGIRVHCPAHNSLTAREYFGEAYMEAKIDEARSRKRAARDAAGGQARETRRGGPGGG